MSYSPLITDSALTSLLDSCPNLEELDLGNCTAAASDRFGAWVRTMQCLTLSSLPFVINVNPVHILSLCLLQNACNGRHMLP